MDQAGNPPENDDSHFSMYDAYGTNIDDDAIMADSAFPVGGGASAGGGWDHHGRAVEAYPGVDIHAANYDNANNAASMDAFGNGPFDSGFRHHESFDQDGHHFPDFLVNDEHLESHALDIHSMDLYVTPSIYPNIGQETSDFGTYPLYIVCSDSLRF